MAAAICVVFAIGAGSASAAVEFGSSCTADQSAEGEISLIALTESGAPAAAPVSGVVTRWQINRGPEGPPAIPQALKVFRPTPSPNQFEVVGESALEIVRAGSNAFDTRIPIQAGDHLGLSGNATPESIYCGEGGPGDSIAALEGSAPIGSTPTMVEEGEKLLLPAVARIEPDADNDGYGDETQDLCPSDASTQGTCPPPPVVPSPVMLDAFPIALRGSVLVLVDSSATAPVTVTGSVRTKRGAITLAAHPTVITPGQFGKVVLRFPGSLKRALRKLPKNRRLALTIAASAPNATGPASTDTTKVMLKGQAPKGHRKKRH